MEDLKLGGFYLRSFQDDPVVQKNRWWVHVSVALFTFMSTLDSSIVNIALPTISDNLKVPMNQAEWVVSIYLIVICAFLLFFGRVADSIGKIKIYKAGTWVFTIGSLLCGINHSLALLLVARVVQAFGAAMTMSTNSGIITEVFPMKERGRALGSVGAFVSLGSIAGPGLGGLLLARLPWSYIFWINVPVGIATILLGRYFLPKDVLMSGAKVHRMGALTFAISIITLFGGIFIGQEAGYLTTVPLILFALAVLSFWSFMVLSKKQDEPLINFAIFKNKLFTISLLTAVFIFAANFFANVVLPFYLQNALGHTAASAGLLMMIFPLVMVVGSPLSGFLIDKIGPGPLTVVGLIILSVSVLILCAVGLDTPIIAFIIASALLGLGNSLFQPANNTTIMSSVEVNELGVASSLNSFARNLGMVIGIASATTILYSAMSQNYGKHVTTYLNDRPDVFMFGMKIVFLAAFVLYFVALCLTVYRFHQSKKIKIK